MESFKLLPRDNMKMQTHFARQSKYVVVFLCSRFVNEKKMFFFFNEIVVTVKKRKNGR